MPELIPLNFGGGSGGPVTTDSITDATDIGKEVLTGDATAGRTALAAAAAADLATLDGRVEDVEDAIGALPTPPTWGTIADKPAYVAEGATRSAARAAIEAVGADVVVALTGDQTIAGTKTFSAPVVVATPTTGGHATTKTYVDGVVATAGADAYIEGHVTTGAAWVVTYNGTSWPALSTVPAAIITAGNPIDWNSERHADAVQPPEMRDGDTWTQLVED